MLRPKKFEYRPYEWHVLAPGTWTVNCNNFEEGLSPLPLFSTLSWDVNRLCSWSIRGPDTLHDK